MWLAQTPPYFAKIMIFINDNTILWTKSMQTCRQVGRHTDKQADISSYWVFKNIKVSKNQIYVNFLCKLIVLSKPSAGCSCKL